MDLNDKMQEFALPIEGIELQRQVSARLLDWYYTTYERLVFVGDTGYLLEKSLFAGIAVAVGAAFNIVSITENPISSRTANKYLSANIFNNTSHLITFDGSSFLQDSIPNEYRAANTSYDRRRLVTHDFTVFNDEIYVLENNRNPRPSYKDRARITIIF